MKASRLLYIDWVRGAAAVIMLQGHVFDSFCATGARSGGVFMFSQFLGGMPPAVFLFLTGITLAFLMNSSERKNLSGRARVWAAFKRSGYLFAIAFLFRIQLWIFAWLFAGAHSPWADLFRVDILNCMGFAIAVFSPMALFRTVERARLCAILGLAIALAAPLISQIDWSGVPPIVKNYLAPDRLFFGFFPWASFLAFGISAGSILRTLDEDRVSQAMLWAATGGIALAFGGQALSNLPYSIYPESDFWLNSPGLVIIKLGVVLLMVSFAYLWTRQSEPSSWSWVRQFGVTSLLVYWVHIELVYGSWFGYLKERLNVPETLLATAVVILLMLVLSLIRTNYPRWAAAWRPSGYVPPVPRRVPGD